MASMKVVQIARVDVTCVEGGITLQIQLQFVFCWRLLFGTVFGQHTGIPSLYIAYASEDDVLSDLVKRDLFSKLG